MKQEQGSRLGLWSGAVLMILSIIGGIISCVFGYWTVGILGGIILLFLGLAIAA